MIDIKMNDKVVTPDGSGIVTAVHGDIVTVVHDNVYGDAREHSYPFDRVSTLDHTTDMLIDTHFKLLDQIRDLRDALELAMSYKIYMNARDVAICEKALNNYGEDK